MDAPGEPRFLRALDGPGRIGGLLRDVGDVVFSLPGPVDDGVTCDRVEPGGCRPALGAVAARRPPDRGERFLCRVLGAAVVAELAERHREDGPREAPIQLLESVPVAV